MALPFYLNIERIAHYALTPASAIAPDSELQLLLC